MSVRRLAEIQPDSFKFSAENARWAKQQISKYPEGKQASAVIPLLWRAQSQNDGWVSEPAIRHVAEFLDMARIRVLEIATFYTMFNLKPVGKHYVQLCGTTPCWLRGSDDLKAVCRKVIGEQGHVTDDGELSWLEVECLGACVNSPMVQINDDYYEDLNAKNFEKLLKDLRAGKKVKPGPQTGRQMSAPAGGFTTLTDPDLFKKKSAKMISGASKKRKAKPAVKAKAVAKPTVKAKAVAKPAVKTKAVAKPKTLAKPKAAAKPATKTSAKASAPKKPRLRKAARKGGPDDLKLISGVGPKLEGVLHALGIFHFDQIAVWTKTEIEWVDDQLKFKGRIARDKWIAQAKKMAKGVK